MPCFNIRVSDDTLYVFNRTGETLEVQVTTLNKTLEPVEIPPGEGRNFAHPLYFQVYRPHAAMGEPSAAILETLVT